MLFALDRETVTHAIQFAVAPVFLLTAVTGLIGAAAGRLARIIDRARLLEDRLDSGEVSDEMAQRSHKELDLLRQRGWLVNGSIALLTLCAILIGLTIVALFLGETIELNVLKVATICFLSCVISFLAALLCFFAETLLATQLLKFGRRPR